MANVPLVSVLTPIFNVEKFLPQCLDSLVAQTMQDIEFICINDGSTDNSLAILEEYAAKDGRFVVVNKTNSGYGSSMNRGLAIAKGEYIGIVESDDYAEPDMFEKLYQIAKDNDCDLARCNRFALTESDDRYEEILEGFSYNQVFKPLDVQEIFVPAPCIWTHVYRREFLEQNQIRFLETPGASFQDTGFVYKSYIAAERMVLIRDALLHYRMDNAGSSVKSSSKVFCVVDEFHSIDEFIAKRPEAHEKFKANLEALRYQAYQWNYNRLGWEARHEFLPAMALDFKTAKETGALFKDAFTVSEWDRVNRLIQDSDAVFDSEAPRVSVIVIAYNCEAHIAYTLDLLKHQSLKDIEILVVNDGSVDSTQKIVESYCLKDGRIVLFNQENKGPGGAKNTGLDHASGKYIFFLDGEDGVPEIGLEMLYRIAEANDADCSIGFIEEFSLVGKSVFSRTQTLSKKEEISRYDLDLVWSFSVNNKLFRRKVIEDSNLRFNNTLLAEDGRFCMAFVFNCGKIVGCPHLVLNYRRDLFWDGFSLTRGSSRQKVLDLVNNHEYIIKLAEEHIAHDIEESESELEKRRLAVAQIEHIASLHQRLVSYLIDLQYRLLWLLDSETVDYMLAKIDEHKVFIDKSQIAGMLKWHSDLPFADGLPNRERLATMPLISIIVSKHIQLEDIPEMLECLYHNAFPRFELIVPASLKTQVPEFYQEIPNICFFADDCSNATFKRLAVENCRASMVLFFEDRVFPSMGALRAIWAEGYNSQADFVVGRIRKIDRAEERAMLYRTQRVLFDKKHVQGFSYRDELNQLDCSLNNKLIKVQALKRVDFEFADSVVDDCKQLYESLSFKKHPSIQFITDLKESDFLVGTNSILYEKCRIEYYKARIKEGQLLKKKIVDPAKKKAEGLVKKTMNPLVKNKIAFFSNRGMSDNMKLIYDILDGEKIGLTEKLPHSAAYDKYAEDVLKQSKLIILDDTCQYLRSIELSKDQHVVQLWHALGAFKKFGLDNLRVGPVFEREAHSQYETVIVSSEYIRPIYARAFGVPISKVLALGSSRTDLLLDSSINESKRNMLTNLHPELQKKKIILYCPTFRQNNGVQCSWSPKIDWDDLSAQLAEDEVLAVKPHPLERFDLLGGRDCTNIIRLEDISTNDLLPSASLVITDYSSIVFDAALLNLPLLFYCPDLEQYQTGFYLDFPNDLCGDLACTYDELIPAIRKSIKGIVDQEKYQMFKEKYIGACDGHSTERIVEHLMSLV